MFSQGETKYRAILLINIISIQFYVTANDTDSQVAVTKRRYQCRSTLSSRKSPYGLLPFPHGSMLPLEE